MSDFVEQIREIVEDSCKQNVYSTWTHHIVHVVRYSKELAKRLGADEEIVELAALLHDFAGVLGDYNDHHVRGAWLAQEVLTGFECSQEKIEKVKHCILAHRNKKDLPPETTEAKIIACADAMAHFDSPAWLLQIAYVENKMETDEGVEWLLEKYERSWNKLLSEGKEMVKHKYECIKIVLGKGKK